MVVERLFAGLDPESMFLVAATALGLPLVALGVLLRLRGRRLWVHATALAGVRRRIADVAPGRVAIAGTWRSVAFAGDGCALVEDDAGARVLVDPRAAPGALAAPLADGSPAFVCGFVSRQADDPRATYRDGGRLWVVEGGDGELTVSRHVDEPERGLRRSRIYLGVGTAALALGVLLASAMIALMEAVLGYGS